MLRYIFIIFLFATASAQAALYKWVDEDGVTRYTTTLPPESAKFDRARINKKGHAVKTYSGAKTEEEKAAEESRRAEAERKAKAARAAKKRDRALQVTYRSVEDIEAKKLQKLKALDVLIKSLEKGLGSSNKAYAALVDQAVDAERSGKMPSEELKGQIRSSIRELDDVKIRLQNAQEDRVQTAQAFDDDIKRYKELKGIE